MATMSSVFRRPRIADGITMICHAGGSRELTGVSLVEDIHHLSQLPSGQVALLTGAASERLSSYQLDIAIRLANSAGSVAVGLVRPVASAGMQSTSRALAERSKLSVFYLAPGRAVGQLMLDIHEELTSSAPAALSRAAAALGAIDRANWSDDPMEELAALVSRELGTQISVGPVNVGAGPQVEVVIEGKRHAAFAYPHQDPASDTVAALVLGRAAWVAEHRMGDARRAAKLPVASRAALLAELIASSSEEAGPLLRRARSAGIAVDGWHTAVHVELDNIVAVTGGDEMARYDTVGEAGRLALQAVLRGPQRWYRADAGSALTLIRTEDVEPAALTPRAVTQSATEVVARLKDQFPVLRLYCGVGGSYRGLDGLQTSATEARAGAAAAHAARRVDQPVAFRNLGLRRSLLQWYAMGSSRILVERLLAPLEELGPKGRDQALRTLQAHLEHPGSAAEAAAAIGVHRNTMNNRVKRLFDFLDLDEHNADHRLLLQLACRMHTL